MRLIRCQRYLVGLEGAEIRAGRERSLGWEVGVIDPGVSESYQWRMEGEDVIAFAAEPVCAEYLKTLGLILMSSGARDIGIYDHEMKCQFWRSPRGEKRRAR